MSHWNTWHDLEDENAMIVIGTISRLLRQLSRESGNPELDGIDMEYAADAMSGDYEHLMNVSYDYAYEHLRATLKVPESR